MKKRAKWKRLLAFALSMAMILGLMPQGHIAYAAEETQESGSVADVIFEAVDGTTGFSDDENYTKLFDGKASSGNGSKWCLEFDSSIDIYVTVKASVGITVKGYTFTTGDDNESWGSGRNPKSWTLYGCNDYDVQGKRGSWKKLHEVLDDTSMEDKNFKPFSFDVPENTSKYQFYKFEFSATRGSENMQLGEISFTYTTCDHEWKNDRDEVPATCTQPGFTVKRCSVCQELQKEENGAPALGHKWERTGEEAATCTENGKIIERCSQCQEERKVDDTNKPAQGHEFDAAHKCIKCGAAQQDYLASVEPTEGDGSKESPYEIASLGNLYWYKEQMSTKGNTIYVKLTADLTLNYNLLKSLEKDSDSNKYFQWEPISGGRTSVFDGNGHTIRGLYCDGAKDNVGFFGMSNNDDTVIKNLQIADTYFGGEENVGGIIGDLFEGTVQNCSFQGIVNGKKYTGGIAGKAGENTNNGGRTNIRSCYTQCQLIQKEGGDAGSIGALVGAVTVYLDVSNCYYDKEELPFGMFGSAYAGDRRSALNKYIPGEQDEKAGVTSAQIRSGVLAYQLSAGDTESLWGQKLGEDQDQHPVIDLRSENKVYVASKGCKTYSNTKPDGDLPVNKHTFSGDSVICDVCGEYDAPSLGQYDLDGDGQMEKAYKIQNASQLYWFQGLVNGAWVVCDYNADSNPEGVRQDQAANAVLTDDITLNAAPEGHESFLDAFVTDAEAWKVNKDMSYSGWKPIGTGNSPYGGIFDGQEHTVRGVVAGEVNKAYKESGNDPQGLFGVCHLGTIQNLSVKDSLSYGNGYVGGICGYVKDGGAIRNCDSEGIVWGSAAGGICGRMGSDDGDGIIENCSSNGQIQGSHAGGICGELNLDTLRKCSSQSAVKGYWVGGICGYALRNVQIENCRNLGDVLTGKTVAFSEEENGYIYAAGGICGYIHENNKVENCYTAGKANIENDIVSGCAGAAVGYVAGCQITSAGISSYGNRVTGCYYDKTLPGEDMKGVGCFDIIGTTTDETLLAKVKAEEAKISNQITGKTTKEFASGEVAYLLEKAQAGNDTDTDEAAESGTENDNVEDVPVVWGQDLTKGAGETYPVLGGRKVYQSGLILGCACTPGERKEASGYTNDGTAEWVYQKEDIDVSGLFWELPEEAFVYDGTSKEIALAGELPEQLHAELTRNRAVKAGAYTAVAVISLKEEYTNQYHIKNCKGSADAEPVTGSSITGAETVSQGSIAVTDPVSGTTITYTEDKAVLTAEWSIAKAELPADAPEKISVDNSCKTLADAEEQIKNDLPKDWSLKVTEPKDAFYATKLPAGDGIRLTVVYEGEDADCYQITEKEIIVSRAPCEEGMEIHYGMEGEKKPTCTAEGVGHTVCALCGEVLRTDVTVEKTPHTLKLVEAVEPTLTQPGNRAYYKCSKCGGYFADLNGKEEIKDKESVILPTLPPAPTENPTESPKAVPTEMPGESSKPSAAPGETTPKPGESSKPSEAPGEATTPKPGESSKPSEAPGEATTPKPGESSKPSAAPGETTTPKPGESSKPSAAPGEATSQPGESSKPSAAPGEAPTPKPGESAQPSEAPGEAPTPKPGESAQPSAAPGEAPTPKPGESAQPSAAPGEATTQPGESSKPSAAPETTPTPQPNQSPAPSSETPVEPQAPAASGAVSEQPAQTPVVSVKKQNSSSKPAAKNTKLVGDDGAKYKVTSSNAKKPTVQYKVTAKTAKKKKVEIPASVTIGGVSYKVTSIEADAFRNNKELREITIGKEICIIGNRAFYGCVNLHKITIKTEKLKDKNVGKLAFSNGYDRPTVKVPSKKRSAYKQILKDHGIGKYTFYKSI